MVWYSRHHSRNRVMILSSRLLCVRESRTAQQHHREGRISQLFADTRTLQYSTETY